MFIQGNCFMVHQASIKVLLLMTNSTLTKLFIPLQSRIYRASTGKVELCTEKLVKMYLNIIRQQAATSKDTLQ